MAAPSTAPSPSAPLPADLAEVTRDESTLRRFLHGLPGVDQVGVEQRAADAGHPRIKKAAKLLGDRHRDLAWST